MAVYGKFWDAYILFNNVELSARVQSVTIDIGNEVLDLSAMGVAAKVRGYGLEDHTLNITFIEDLAASGDNSVNATLRAARATAAPFPVKFRLIKTDAIGTINPQFECNYILPRLPVGGRHGDLLTTAVTLPSAGALTINVTPA